MSENVRAIRDEREYEAKMRVGREKMRVNMRENMKQNMKRESESHQRERI